MPPLATNERDLAAEALLTSWINTALPNRLSFTQWQTAKFGGSGGAAAQPAADPDGDGQNNTLEFFLGEEPLTIDPPYLPMAEAESSDFTLSFVQPATRSAIVETTTDFQTWSLWDVPGNAPFFPAQAQVRVLTGPRDVPKRFFRVRLGVP
jgi:hypothetical protein